MAAEVNLTIKYSPLIDERFKLASITDKFAGKKYSWDGSKTIRVYSVDHVTLGDYTRSGTTRYGTVAELTDTTADYALSQDKAFTFSIDEGNAKDQMNIKQCNEQLKSNWDEVCTPAIDTWRFKQWVLGAGGSTVETLTKANVIESIMTGGAALSNAYVPRQNRACFIKESIYIKLKLASEIIGIDTLGAESVKNGIVGYLDGMAIVPVPDTYFIDAAATTNFLIKYKDSTADPMKLKVVRVQHNPLGVDGDVGECRFYHDAFVLANKKNGLYVSKTA